MDELNKQLHLWDFDDTLAYSECAVDRMKSAQPDIVTLTFCRYFKEVFIFMDKALDGGKRKGKNKSSTSKIFVNCAAGKSRSATFVAAYLMMKLKIS